MSDTKIRSYHSDDRDLAGCDMRLDVFQGENGDWYVSICPSSHKGGPACVRITTSGNRFPEAANAVADLFRALEGSHREHAWVYDDANGQTCEVCGRTVGTKELCFVRPDPSLVRPGLRLVTGEG